MVIKLKKKWLFIIGILLVIIVLSFSRGNDTESSNVIIDDDTIVYEETYIVDKTSNLFSITGLKLASIIEKCFSMIFSIINKLLEFAFGI